MPGFLHAALSFLAGQPLAALMLCVGAGALLGRVRLGPLPANATLGTLLAVAQAIVGHTNVAMTELYFHVSDSVLNTAAAVLPDITGRETKALPSPEDPIPAFRAFVESMNAEQKAQALAILQAVVV